MSAYTDFVVDQGTDFETTLDLIGDDGVPIDITNFTFRGQIRKSYTSANATANLTITALSPLSNGNTVISMNAATTANIAFGRYVYDVTAKDSANTVSRLVEGIITITPSVTR